MEKEQISRQFYIPGATLEEGRDTKAMLGCVSFYLCISSHPFISLILVPHPKVIPASEGSDRAMSLFGLASTVHGSLTNVGSFPFYEVRSNHHVHWGRPGRRTKFDPRLLDSLNFPMVFAGSKPHLKTHLQVLRLGSPWLLGLFLVCCPADKRMTPYYEYLAP